MLLATAAAAPLPCPATTVAPPSADLFHGAAITAFPIVLPPTYRSLTPGLALTYDSRHGPSPYGYGWDLALGRIERVRHAGIPSCTTERGRYDFVVQIPPHAVECRLDLGTGVCRPQRADAHLRIRYRRNRWDVWDDDGRHYRFGMTAAARTGRGTDTLFEPGPVCRDTAAWALSRVDGREGTLRAHYRAVNGVLYPMTLHYSATGGATRPVRVSFDWIDRPLSDRVVDGRGGFLAQLTQVLSRITVSAPGSATPPRTYELRYEFQDGTTGRAFLSSVVSTEGERGSTAPVRLFYQHYDPHTGPFGFGVFQDRFAPPPAAAPPDLGATVSEADGATRETIGVLDMNGDGFLDLVRADCDGSWTIYPGSPRGFSSTPAAWRAPAGALMCGLRLTVAAQHRGCGQSLRGTATVLDTFDIDGDGIADFIDARALPWRVYRGAARTGQAWGFLPAIEWRAERTGTRYAVGGVQDRESGSLTTLDVKDMSGDALPDLVESWPATCGGYHWKVWPNTGSGFGTSATLAAPSNAIEFTTDARAPAPGASAQSARTLVSTRDMNGDGLPDYVSVFSSTQWQVCWHSGRAIADCERIDLSSFGEGGASLRTVRFDEHGEMSVVRDLLDVNGDGLPDVVDGDGAAPNSEWAVRLNQGHGFSTLLPWSTRLPIGEAIRTAACVATAMGQCTEWAVTSDTLDIDGDGFVDHANRFGVWRNLGGAWSATAWNAAGGGTKIVENKNSGPNLLIGVQGEGLTASLAYRPSTVWDNSDVLGAPRLPFLTWTVVRIDRGVDHEDFTYAGGRSPAAGQELRGFRVATTSHANGGGSSTWFFQDDANAGRVQYRHALDPTREPHRSDGTLASSGRIGMLNVPPEVLRLLPVGAAP